MNRGRKEEGKAADDQPTASVSWRELEDTYRQQRRIGSSKTNYPGRRSRAGAGSLQQVMKAQGEAFGETP